MSNDMRLAIVGTDRFAVAPLEKDSASELTYGAIVELDKILISVKNTPNMSSNSLAASDQIVDTFAAKNGGTLDVNVVGLTADDENLFFGDTVSAEGLITSNKDDVIPFLMTIYSTKRSDGTLNLYKYPKSKYTSQGEGGTTRTEDNITYNTTTLNAKYSATIFDGNDKHVMKGVDPKTTEGRALIDEWFSSPEGGIPTVTP